MVVPDGRGDEELTGVASAIVAVGNELLYGQTVDTNAAWLGRRLTELGLPVCRRFTVPDVDEEIRDAVVAAREAASVVIVSGGLGPTDDDRTRPAVAELFGRPLLHDEAIYEAIRVRFADAGFDQAPEPSRAVARVPEGASVLPNEYGTAPGLVIEDERGLVILLPGVPREFKGLFDDQVAPLLTSRFEGRIRPVAHTDIYTAGIPESRLFETVHDLLPAEDSGLGVAFLPDLYGVHIRLSAPAGLQEALLSLQSALGDRLAPWVYEAASGDLADALVARLRARSLSLGVAESCTGGLAGARLTAVPGSSDVFVGGIIAYANSVKTDVLGVDPSVLASDGAVSEGVALQMAEGVATRLATDVGCSITGVAGPGGGSEEKPVGTVWIGVHTPKGSSAARHRFPGDRYEVRERAAQATLRSVFEALGGE